MTTCTVKDNGFMTGLIRFLTISQHLSLLPFEIVRDSLNAAFTRRNVGYLYAIKNGAK